MFKLLKIEFYDNFKCLMDRCTDNCCDEEWSISIDEDTYRKYKELQIEKLDDKISAVTPHRIIKQNGKCPFISKEGLCLIHAEYGETYLSNTCKSYPRFISEYKDMYVANLGISCPAVAEWLVNLDHKCRILEEVYYETEEEKGKEIPVTSEEQLMRSVLDCFYDEDCFGESMDRCFRRLEIEDSYQFKTEFYKKYSFVLQNMGICYLFENIMLQSKYTVPDYKSVVKRFADIIVKIENQYTRAKIESNNQTEINLSDIIYKIMRIEDHQI